MNLPCAKIKVAFIQCEQTIMADMLIDDKKKQRKLQAAIKFWSRFCSKTRQTSLTGHLTLPPPSKSPVPSDHLHIVQVCDVDESFSEALTHHQKALEQ